MLCVFMCVSQCMPHFQILPAGFGPTIAVFYISALIAVTMSINVWLQLPFSIHMSAVSVLSVTHEILVVALVHMFLLNIWVIYVVLHGNLGL